MARTLGQFETLLLAHVQMRNCRTVRTGDLTGPLRITAKQEGELLSRMARRGLIAQVRRGLYLVPPRLPLGGKWNPDEGLALNTLMEDQKGCCQICGPNAFNRYGFDEQVPARLYVYNNRLSGQRTIGTVALVLIKVADSRLGDTEEVRTPEGLAMVYSSRVRTLLDAVYDWSRFGSLPRAYDWIRRDLKAGRVRAADLVKVTLRYGNQGTMRRIGALLEQLGASASLLRKLQRALKPSSSLIPWVPNRPKRGAASLRWGVVLNEGR
jgi:predicted transcriptional regulator of viral defense system